MKQVSENLVKNALRSFIFVILLVLINSPIINNFFASQDVLAMNSETITVLGGGFPIGLEIQSDGVLIVGRCEVLSVVGKVLPKSDFVCGDIIKRINNTEIKRIGDIANALKEIKEETKVIVTVNRHGVEQKLDTYPVKEEYSNELKLGIFVRDNISGVGTMTFIKENGEFACLGHPICDQDTQALMPCLDGNLFQCNIIGFEKGQRGKPGGLKGQLTGKSIGKIKINCKYGVYGNVENLKAMNGGLLKAFELATRKDVRVGKATILTTIDSEVKEYSIEIIRCFNQNVRNDKSMVIRVTDPVLLEKTGGIIQGMSGSPIIQNGKIIGAVTHVFVNDPTKGYGIYADWML